MCGGAGCLKYPGRGGPLNEDLRESSSTGRCRGDSGTLLSTRVVVKVGASRITSRGGSSNA
jgi:hypothetical protein